MEVEVAAPNKWDGVIGKIRAALWDAHYGKELSVEYARSADADLDELASQLHRVRQACEAALSAMDALEPYLSTEAQLLDYASLNEGRASGFDTASVKARKAAVQLRQVVQGGVAAREAKGPLEKEEAVQVESKSVIKRLTIQKGKHHANDSDDDSGDSRGAGKG